MFVDVGNYTKFSEYMSLFISMSKLNLYTPHKTVANADDADIIIVLDPHLLPRRQFESAMSSNSAVRNNLDRVFVYNETDNPSSSYRGLYVSMPKPLFDTERHVSTIYWGIRDHDECRSDVKRNGVGFRGDCRTHPVRAKLHMLKSMGFDIFDTSRPETLSLSHNEFIEELASYQYYLCPRGHGTASIRMFECMAIGTVPIVVSDNYVFPRNITNGYNCIQIPEKSIGLLNIPLDASNVLARNVRQSYKDNWCLSARWDTYIDGISSIIDSPARNRYQYLKSLLYFKIQHLAGR
jgi:hypothetical protein